MKLFCFLLCVLSFNYAIAWINVRLLRPRVMLRLRNSEGIDISPKHDRSIMKLVQRRGDHLKPTPMDKDTVEIAWRIFDANNSLIHDSMSPATSNSNDQQDAATSDKTHSDIIEHEDDNFSFEVGAEPRQIILGWEYAVKSMREGEKAEVVVAPEFGFGERGAPPLIEPNATLKCELELLKIIPALSRRFRAIGLNESIREDLLEQMERGDVALTEAVLNSDNGSQPPVSNANRDSTALDIEEHVESTDYIDVTFTSPTAPTPASAAVSAKQSVAPAAVAAEKHAHAPQAAQARFFDPKKDKLDARLRVSGEAADGSYSWTETTSALEVEIPLRAHHSRGLRVSKQDVEVVITSEQIHVAVKMKPNSSGSVNSSTTGTSETALSNKQTISEQVVLLSGPLQGHLAPSSACWALQEYGQLEAFRRGAAQGLQLSADKAHGFRDFWASVLSGEHLSATTAQQQQ